jgi:hypothetical protein
MAKISEANISELCKQQIKKGGQILPSILIFSMPSWHHDSL